MTNEFSSTGEVMVCVLDFKRDVGLWHGILTVSYISNAKYNSLKMYHVFVIPANVRIPNLLHVSVCIYMGKYMIAGIMVENNLS